jgi:energy-coupling factor transporter ATP-binding protein EcfA2
MITRLKVDGFRSLSHFDMVIHPGLNILVGPNGSGKTNIVSFLQFLSYMTTYPLADAVTKAGGAGAVFQKIGSRQYRKGLTASIEGSYNYAPLRDGERRLPPGSSSSTIHYIYTFELSASPELDVVIYQIQALMAWKTKIGRRFSLRSTPDIQIQAETQEEGEPTFNIQHFRPEKFDISVLTRHQKVVDEVAVAVLRQFATRSGALEEPLFQRIAQFISDFRYLRTDFTGGEIFNIIPSQVRLPEDSAKPPIIQSDGSGLAPTLYALQRHTRRWTTGGPYGFVRRVLPSGIYPQIIRYLQTVNETIVSLSVVNDPFDNRLKVGVGIIGEEGEIELPFSSMSDGTVKWASLITAILTYETIFAIEEPENFLHPLMQREILNIMRENVERRGGNSFVLMTTHSETLLNAAAPSEVVVVSISNGITRTDRPSDPESLRKQIQRTGFGLGYFYISGALDHA